MDWSICHICSSHSKTGNKGKFASEYDKDEFQGNLSHLLCSTHGVFFRSFFTFGENSSLKCLQPASPVLLAITPFSHRVLKDSKGQKSALHKTKDMVKESNMSGYSFAHSEQYFHWETSESIESSLGPALEPCLLEKCQGYTCGDLLRFLLIS